MGKFVLPIAFLIVPFALISPGIVHKGHYHAFLISALAVLPFIEGKAKVSPYLRGLYVYLALLMLLCTIALMFKFIGRDVFNGAFMGMFYLLAAGILYLAALNSPLSRRTWANVICTAAILQMAIAGSQAAGFAPVQWLFALFAKVDPGKQLVVGTLGNKGFLVMFLAITMPFFFRRRWFWFIIPMLVLMAFANTTTAIIAAFAGAAVYFYPKMKIPNIDPFWQRVSMVTALVLIVGAFVLFVDTDLSKAVNRGPKGIFLVEGRIHKWGIAVEQVSMTWPSMLFGLGPGSRWGGKGTLHNDWLTAWHVWGLVGLGLVMGFVFNIERSNRRAFAAFVVACVAALGSLPMHLAPSAFLIIIIAGLCEREKVLNV